jgi:DNA-binding MurR/RpiR family transcriptional regulator
VRASELTARVKDILRAQLFTGPTNVSLSPAQLREEIAKGNTNMIRHAQQTMDEDQLMRLMNG